MENKIVEDFFKKENIYEEDFFKYIKNRIYYFPSDTSLDWFGCFPIVDDNDILVDIKVAVPKIKTEKNILFNLHEIFHAYELYHELGSKYVEKIEERELSAKTFEKKYKKIVK